MDAHDVIEGVKGDPQVWGVTPLLALPFKPVRIYFESLIDSGLLRQRLCDVENPTWDDVVDMIGRMGRQMYLVSQPDGRVLAEFTLDNFTGKSAQVHFSMWPENRPQFSMHLARTVTDQVLNAWTLQDSDEPYLYSLYGLTPVKNRAACAFVQRVGFKKVCILPGGHKYQGRIDDALVTIKARDGYGIEC